MTKGFKKAFGGINQELTGDFSADKKKGLYAQTKMYIYLQEFLKKLTPFLAKGEVIQAYLPLTNQDNTGVMTGGLMGMAYARTPAARDYVESFHDVRGNRLLVFTNQRLLFLVMVEFLEEELYYSYPYSTIQSLMFRKNKVGYFDWSQKSWRKKRQHLSYYTFDFQSEAHIFTEMLSVEDAEIIKRQLAEIPQLKKIVITEKARRNTKLDFVLSNSTWQLKVLTDFSFIFLAAAIGYLLAVLIGFLGWGPLKSLFL